MFRKDKELGHWTITHGFLLEMDGLVDNLGVSIHSVDNEILDPLDLSEEEIRIRAKANSSLSLRSSYRHRGLCSNALLVG